MTWRMWLTGLGLIWIVVCIPAWVTLSGEFFVARVAESFGLMMGSLLMGAVIWYPVRWVDGASRTPEIKTFTLGFTAITLVLYLANNLYGPR